MDRGIIELFGPNGISTNIYSKSSKISRIQIGFLFHYIFVLLFFIGIYLLFIGYWHILISLIDYKVILLTVIYFWFSITK